ncbi:MAG: hypothetical protein JXB07_02135 [Anaerolineae bacterium]|nr:hypothetical protein [Anaerolineae bacterium]
MQQKYRKKRTDYLCESVSDASDEATQSTTGNPTDIALYRSQHVADIVDHLLQELGKPIRADGVVPDKTILGLIAHLLIAASKNPGIEWHRSQWHFLKNLSIFATIVNGRRTLLSHEKWPEKTWALVMKMAESVDMLRYPMDLQGPRKIHLENFETLQEQGLKPHQICKAYGWLKPDGNPDLEKYGQAECGELEPPKYTELPPDDNDWPTFQPSLDQVKAAVVKMEKELMELARRQLPLPLDLSPCMICMRIG